MSPDLNNVKPSYVSLEIAKLFALSKAFFLKCTV